ncbi:MAG: hypothetical protein A2Y81_11655 [Nitrospirae bacterium RBG_13_43_8]|nr:MAG: hypothetical protein A2Y81_11655 [Nitrospirae bacterium RBG_13_43_8]
MTDKIKILAHRVIEWVRSHRKEDETWLGIKRKASYIRVEESGVIALHSVIIRLDRIIQALGEIILRPNVY